MTAHGTWRVLISGFLCFYFPYLIYMLGLGLFEGIMDY